MNAPRRGEQQDWEPGAPDAAYPGDHPDETRNGRPGRRPVPPPTRHLPQYQQQPPEPQQPPRRPAPRQGAQPAPNPPGPNPPRRGVPPNPQQPQPNQPHPNQPRRGTPPGQPGQPV